MPVNGGIPKSVRKPLRVLSNNSNRNGGGKISKSANLKQKIPEKEKEKNESLDRLLLVQSKKICSDVFLTENYKWRLLVFPKGNNNAGLLSIYLDVADSANLPFGWCRFATFSFTVVNQVNRNHSITKETGHKFSAIESDWGFTSFMFLSELHDPSRGFIVNDTCTVEVHVKFVNRSCLQTLPLNVPRKMEKAEENLYVIVKVARDEDLVKQIGSAIHFDLVDHDKVHSFRVLKQTTFKLFKSGLASFGIGAGGKFSRMEIFFIQLGRHYLFFLTENPFSPKTLLKWKAPRARNCLSDGFDLDFVPKKCVGGPAIYNDMDELDKGVHREATYFAKFAISSHNEQHEISNNQRCLGDTIVAQRFSPQKVVFTKLSMQWRPLETRALLSESYQLSNM